MRTRDYITLKLVEFGVTGKIECRGSKFWRITDAKGERIDALLAYLRREYPEDEGWTISVWRKR